MAKRGRLSPDQADWQDEQDRQDEARSAVVSARLLFAPYKPPAGVVGSGEGAMAMDAAPFGGDLEGLLSTSTFAQLAHEGIGFPGYAYLSQMALRGEYINITHTLSREFFRTWGKFVSKSGADRSVEIAKLNEAMERLKVRETLRTLYQHDLTFGCGRCLVRIKGDEAPGEMASQLTTKPEKIAKGSLKGFRVVEPIWMTPKAYEATDPLAEDFYRPTQWWVQGTTIDATRIVSLVTRPMPDILKPAWNFGGVPLVLMAKPYVTNWLRTRQNVSDIINTLRLMVLSTNQADQVATGTKTRAGGIRQRIRLLQKTMDNFGVLLLNQNETFQNVTTPLTELADLQAQALEQICSMVNIPVVKFTSNQPAGLNASSDNELRTFYDTGASVRENDLTPAINRMTDLIQMSEFGQVNDDLVWQWDGLYEETPAAKLDMELKKAQIREIDSATGAGSSDDLRAQIAGDPDSIYAASGVDMSGPAPEAYPDIETDRPEDMARDDREAA